MPAISLLAKSYTYTNGNPNDADEVELDLANTFANFSTIQTDYNQLVTGAYTIAGVKTFSSAPKIDQINPATSNGATALTLAGAGVNAQTGATYTIVTGDRYKLVTLNNASAVAVTLPQAGSTGFGNNFEFEIKNIGAGVVTITPTTSTIDGGASLTLTQNESLRIYSNNSNYFSVRGTIPTAAQGASLVFLASATASNSANLAFESLFSSTYDKYIFEGIGIVPATDNVTLQAQFRISSSYATANYTWGGHLTTVNAGGFNGVAGTTGIAILLNAGNATDEVGHFTAELWNPLATTYHKHFSGRFQQEYASNSNYSGYFGGYYTANNSALDGIRFNMSSGNITSGRIDMYGVRKS